MGCGQSSLKGDKKEDITEAPQPIKKVATNFSTVNYDSTNTQGRRNTEYAPHDDITHKPSEALSPLTEKRTNPLSTEGAAQPGTTTTSVPGATELPAQTSQHPVGGEPSKIEPYKDVTASPTTPTASNAAAAAFPESQPTTKPTQ